jgi:hypothetical protein
MVDETKLCFAILFAPRPSVHFDTWLSQVRVEDPTLALRVERLVTVDPQSALQGDDLVFVEPGPHVDQDVEDKCRLTEIGVVTSSPRHALALALAMMRSRVGRT